MFTGTVPPELGLANTSVNWAGVGWTMVVWPLPEYHRNRIRLMAHECFHRIQPQLGQQLREVLNNQLDTRDGRIWLELEIRALERAVGDGMERRHAIAEALCFRTYRRTLFPGSGPRENALEIHEGLPEYTGDMLASRSVGEAMTMAEDGLQTQSVLQSSFVRSFAYCTGPAYGYLLDQRGQAWRSKVQTGSDLGQMVSAAYRVATSAALEAEALRRAQAYDGDEIIARETDRDLQHKKAVADATARLIDGPVLILPLSPNVRYTFDPYNVLAIDENKSAYPTTQITDVWGILTVDLGALLMRDKGQLVRAQVPALKDENSREGSGWRPDLKTGLKLEKAKREGDWMVTEVASESGH